MADRGEITAAAGRLRRQLEGVREHQRSVWFGEGMALILAVLVPCMGFAMVADNLAHLHVVIRLAILGGLIALAVVLFRYVARLLRQPLNAEMIAVKVERKFPEIDNHLINSLLLAHEDDEEVLDLVNAVVQEGNADATRKDLRAAVPKRRMRLLALGATAAVAMMATYAALFPNHFGNALARLLAPFAGTPPLTRTKILAVKPGDHNLLAGDDVTVTVQVDGKIPETCEIVYEAEGDEVQMAILRPEATSQEATGRLFRCLMADVSKTFIYHVLAGDAESDTWTVTVHHRPVIEKLDVRITPPSYTGLGAMVQQSGTVKALAGSTVAIEATCSKEIANASLALGDKEPQAMSVSGKIVSGSFKVEANGTYRILLTDTFGFDNKPAQHDVELLVDEPPEIKLAAPPPTSVVKPDASIPFHFTVTDRYGVQSVELIRVDKGDEGKTKDTVLKGWTAPGKDTRTVTASALSGGAETLVMPVSQLGIGPGASAIFVIVAKDWNDVSGPGVTRSRQAVVTVMKPKEASEQSRENLEKAALELAQIIQKQRRNIGLGRILAALEKKKAGAAKTDPQLADSIRLQEDIRESSGKLIALMDDMIPMKPVIKGLYTTEMVTAIWQLRAIEEAKEVLPALDAAVTTEQEILLRLTGRTQQLRANIESSALRDVFAALEALIRKQKSIRAETSANAGADLPNKPLADRQDKLTTQLEAFKELLAENAKEMVQGSEEMAKRFEEAVKMVESRQIRQNMILSAIKLGKGKLAEAVPAQDQVLAGLAAIEKFLREPVAEAAAKKLEDLADVLEEGKEKAERMKDLAAAIKEISEELERSKDLREQKDNQKAELPDELRDLEEKLHDAKEELAKDLSLFPEIPACNEVVEELREVFEDVEQQPGSENAEAKEIAVDRDEGLLEAMKNVEERMDDMEMWLMDKPDAERWKQEGWDVNEMPEIPLVDLPEEMEDLVGDLVDKSEEMDEAAQDSASNATFPDLPAGWDVADGPMPSFGAKGKSGNEKPNANEMMGRSGPGREGNANGEIVGKVAKDLEGRETKVRRTHDPFAEGTIEEENPNSKAKATGGGKQSGAGGEGGLKGSAPPRDELAMRELARRQRNLRRDTENTFSKAALMQLPTGEIDEAIILMHKAEELAAAGDWAGFSETQKRIAHALKNTKRALQGKGSVEMDPLRKLPMDLKEEMMDTRDEPIPPEFERLVSEYYKAIAAGALK